LKLTCGRKAREGGLKVATILASWLVGLRVAWLGLHPVGCGMRAAHARSCP
jgi:hypothetical protein